MDGAAVGAFAIERFRLYGVAGVIEAAAWLVLLVGAAVVARSFRPPPPEVRRRALALATVALAARLVVPHVPFNWWYGVSNLPWARGVFSKDTSWEPLVHRLIAFDLGLGFRGLVAFGIAANVGAILLLWSTARRAGYGERVAWVFVFLLALVPAYVRLSASDAIHLVPFVLWAVAAAAFVAVRDGRGGVAMHLVLGASTLLAGLFRAETMLLLPSIPFFVGKDPAGWRALWVARRRFLAFGLGLLVAVPLMWAHHLASFSLYFHEATSFDGSPALAVSLAVGRVLFGVFFRCLLPTNFLFGSYVPAILQLPIWYSTWKLARARAWPALAALYVPQAIFSIPAVVAGKESVGFLPESAYHLVYLVFVLVACAQGVVALEAPVRAWLATWPRRLGAALVAVAVVWMDLVVPWFGTYAYEEEFTFLERWLPRDEATIVAIWDPRNSGGDFDACLALPYPPMLPDRPRLRWRIVGGDDLRGDRWKDLRFDYYYPGCLTQISLSPRPAPAFVSRFVDASRRADGDARLAELQRLDTAIRAHFELTPIASEEVPAESFSDYGFAADRMRLTLYRRANAP
ncbi:MAG: hypothetical protein U0228_05455 [Myxococcaceae bacterium]